MRTTVTLDPDVEKILRTAMRERGLSFKEVLNDAVRSGLAKSKSPASKPFVIPTFAMGEPLFRWEKALAFADALEDEEIIRKMALRK